jgi:hypothetical protein
VAHKTGTLHDTLNDVGIVYLAGQPYAIAVLTTNLPDLETGRAFIRNVSRLAYNSFKQMERRRVAAGAPAFGTSATVAANQASAPDLAMWDSHPGNAAAGVWHNTNFVP